ncbi:hypothetical protein CUR95_19135 [Bordetella bronchiseptica]|nr:hypothetical protein [Bordetella bronchiseptica]
MRCAGQLQRSARLWETMSRITKLFNLNDPGWGRGNNNGNGSEPPRRPQGGGDGPPDLDEVWRDFNNRIGALFGRKGGGATIVPTTAAA